MPEVEIEAKVSVSSPDKSIGGNGNLTGLSCHGNYLLTRVMGTIHADPKTAGRR
jgi:hypothetical protein